MIYKIICLLLTLFLHFSLLKAKTEEELVRNKIERLPIEVDLQEFARLLRLDDKELSTQQLFKIQDRVNRKPYLICSIL